MGKKLLVADDSATIQKVIKLALSSGNYEILTVSDGKEAIRAIEQERPDVVLIDVALPNVDACNVKRKIQQQPELASIKFILMASAFERLNEVLAPDVRFDERLIKPFDPAHLRKIIAQLMEKDVIQPPPTKPIQTPEKPLDLPPMIPQYETITEEPKAPPMTTEEFEMVLPQTSSLEDEKATVHALESDIKNLTESMIKMSGVDELHWNLDDKRKMKTTSASTTTFDLEKIASIKPMDDGGSSFLKTQPKGLRNVKSISEAPPPEMITKTEVERIVRQDLEGMIEKLVHKMIVEVTEKVVRKEIEKILAEP